MTKPVTENKWIVGLTSLIYDSHQLHHKVVQSGGQAFVCLESISETQSLRNGLQAALYRGVDDPYTLYLIIRGADVGLGRRIFQWFQADERFIPKSSEDNEWRSTFQDWLYTSLLGGLGLVHLYQYDSLREFYQRVRKQYPAARIVVAGHSLGGLLAQRLYLLEEGISECTTFAALSPWWTLPSQVRRDIKKAGFLKKDSQLVNYYSAYDVFRVFPFFRRNIGLQKNVLLHPFQSRTNFLATFLERIYWAHVPNYYLYDKDGQIKVVEEESKIEKIYRRLNQPAPYHMRLNVLVLCLAILLASGGILLYLFGVDMGFLPSVLQENSMNGLTLGAIIFVSVLYFLPSLLVASRWKGWVLVANLLMGWLLWPWLLLLGFAWVLHAIQDEGVDEDKNKND